MKTLVSYRYFVTTPNEKNINRVTVDLDYRTGNDNPYRTERRGYYASFTPTHTTQKNGYATIVIDGRAPGFRVLLKEVGRQSKKAAQEALQQLDQSVQFYLRRLEDDLAITIDEDMKPLFYDFASIVPAQA